MGLFLRLAMPPALRWESQRGWCWTGHYLWLFCTTGRRPSFDQKYRIRLLHFPVPGNGVADGCRSFRGDWW
jgi:hypothetical protein